MAYRSRNLIELQVGKKYIVQVQFHLRSCDLEWFNKTGEENIAQLLSLISKHILPSEFQEEIQHKSRHGVNGKNNTEKKNPPPEGNDKKRKASNATGGGKDKKMKTSRARNPSKKSKESKNSRSAYKKKEEEKKTYLSTLGTKFLFGETLQITYRIKPIQSGHHATLTFIKPKQNDEGKLESKARKPKSAALSTFKYLQPLQKRVIIWCYPFDAMNPKHPLMDTTDGFPRPEFIPISSLFKESRDAL